MLKRAELTEWKGGSPSTNQELVSKRKGKFSSKGLYPFLTSIKQDTVLHTTNVDISGYTLSVLQILPGSSPVQ